ncbi:MAG: YceI family protein [Bacteroidetes bacterium]|nr:YceI family protein [Bacteroidota bacterium]
MKSSMAKKTIQPAVLFFLILFHFQLSAQKKFASDKGEVSFTSNAKLELINASTKRVAGMIDPANGHFAFIVKVQSFEGFNSSLQQQHFNEKYMETDKYYDATYSGNIIDPIDYTKDGTYDVRAKGNLIIHGKRQERIIPSKIQIDKGVLTIHSDFEIPLADHDIQVPQIVSAKIATVIIVKLNVSMTQK